MATAPTTYNYSQQIPLLKEGALKGMNAVYTLYKEACERLTADRNDKDALNQKHRWALAEHYPAFCGNTDLKKAFANKEYPNYNYDIISEAEYKELEIHVNADLRALVAKAGLSQGLDQQTANAPSANFFNPANVQMGGFNPDLNSPPAFDREELLANLKQALAEKTELIGYQTQLQQLLTACQQTPTQINLLVEAEAELGKPRNSKRMQSLIEFVENPLFAKINLGRNFNVKAQLQYILKQNFKNLLWNYFSYAIAAKNNPLVEPVLNQVLHLSATAIYKFLSRHNLAEYHDHADLKVAYYEFLYAKLGLSDFEKEKVRGMGAIQLYGRSSQALNSFGALFNSHAAKNDFKYAKRCAFTGQPLKFTPQQCFDQDFAELFFNAPNPEAIRLRVCALPLLIEVSHELFNHAMMEKYLSSRRIS